MGTGQARLAEKHLRQITERLEVLRSRIEALRDGTLSSPMKRAIASEYEKECDTGEREAAILKSIIRLDAQQIGAANDSG